jgi:hypothetical protein
LRGTATPSVSRKIEEREPGGPKGFADMRTRMRAGNEDSKTCLREDAKACHPDGSWEFSFYFAFIFFYELIR